MKKSIVTIIAFYNGSKYIKRALDSVINQTVSSEEIIIVDDGSRQEEYEYLLNIQKIYKFDLYRKKNGGQGSARNYGVSKSKSCFITFLDQDDYYLPRHNEYLLDGVDRDDPMFGWSYGDLWHADEEGKVLNRSLLSDAKSKHPKVDIKEMLSNDLFILPSAALISRKAYEDVGGFDEQFRGYEDDDLFIRLFRNGWSNVFVKKTVSAWCINANSTSYSINMAISRLRYFKKLLLSFPDTPFNNNYLSTHIIIPRFLEMILNQAIKYCEHPDDNSGQYLKIMKEFKLIISNFNSIDKEHLKLVDALIQNLNEIILKNLQYKSLKSQEHYKNIFASNLFILNEVPYIEKILISGKKIKMIDLEKFKQ